MKKLILAAVLAAFATTSFSAAYACDGKNHDKTNANTAAGKKQEKKADEAAPKTDQKS
jgi:Ni/Co efflux regulator RcnB